MSTDSQELCESLLMLLCVALHLSLLVSIFSFPSNSHHPYIHKPPDIFETCERRVRVWWFPPDFTQTHINGRYEPNGKKGVSQKPLSTYGMLKMKASLLQTINLAPLTPRQQRVHNHLHPDGASRAR
jgi:hypothetical protein